MERVRPGPRDNSSALMSRPINYPRGKHKARVSATLGFTAENADELRAAPLNAAASDDAQVAASDRFGDRYVLEFAIEGPHGNGIVRSTWIVRRGERAPRLTSCFVKYTRQSMNTTPQVERSIIA
jgi:hypothetical protein